MFGFWFWELRYKIWIRRRCPHPLWRLECLHVEDYRRPLRWVYGPAKTQCLECKKFLRRLPAVCFWTGDPH